MSYSEKAKLPAPTDRSPEGLALNLCLALSKLFLERGILNRFGFRKPEITRFDSMENYIADRSAQTDDYIKLFVPYASFNNKTVLEVGCSKGYLINSFLQHESFHAIGADIDPEVLKIANEKFGQRIKFIQTTESSIPLPDSSVDIIYTIDTVEHLSKINEIFADCHRILRPGGTMLVHFQGWYGPYGSHLEDIISFPWANAFFSMDTLLEAAARLYDSPNYDIACYYVDQETGERKPNPYLDKAKWEEFLNHLTIRQFRQILQELPFNVEHFENIGFGGRTFRLGRYLGKLSKLPLLNEFFTKATFAVLRKADN